MRPLAAIGVWKRLMLPMASSAPPPAKTISPVSPFTPISLLSLSAVRYQTMLSALPSVVVTMGEPLPCAPPHHLTEIAGGDAAEIPSAVSAPEPDGQPMPGPRNVTNV